jgi:hypothetical protein
MSNFEKKVVEGGGSAVPPPPILEQSLKRLITEWRERARRVRPLEHGPITAEKRARIAEWMHYTNRASELETIIETIPATRSCLEAEALLTARTAELDHWKAEAVGHHLAWEAAEHEVARLKALTETVATLRGALQQIQELAEKNIALTEASTKGGQSVGYSATMQRSTAFTLKNTCERALRGFVDHGGTKGD